MTGDLATGFTLTNTHTPETVTVTVKGEWNDKNNQDGKRTEITAELYADGTATGNKVVLNAANNYTSSFEAAKYKGGNAISYTVQASAVPAGYTASVSGNTAAGFIVTGAYVPETVNISVKNVWNDGNNEDGIRTSSITVELYADNVTTGKKVTLNAANSWTAVFSGVAKYKDGGKLISYTVKETAVPANYTVSVSGNAQTGYTLTNSHTPVPKSFKLKLSATSYTYDGKAKKPAVTVTSGNKTVSSAYYTVTYTNNVKVGTATVTVKGKGIYQKCSAKATFKINARPLKLKLKTSSYTYTGKAKKPAVTVYVGNKKINKKYYTITYSNNKNVGTATVTVKGKGNYQYYEGTATFQINFKKPAKPTLKSSKKTKATVKWKRDKQAQGYQIQYSTNKKFKSGVQTVSINKSTTVSTTLSNLKSKKTYYVRIRSYKKVGNKYVYSSWSTAKSIKVK